MLGIRNLNMFKAKWEGWWWWSLRSIECSGMIFQRGFGWKMNIVCTTVFQSKESYRLAVCLRFHTNWTGTFFFFIHSIPVEGKLWASTMASVPYLLDRHSFFFLFFCFALGCKRPTLMVTGDKPILPFSNGWTIELDLLCIRFTRLTGCFLLS